MLYKLLLTLLLPVVFCSTGLAYDYDPNDFAVEYEYDNTGVGATHNDPSVALGRPTVDTYYAYQTLRPVLPVFPASGSHEVVTVGYGGQLILKFSHRVSDDVNNPFGVDFIVFGNTWQMIGFPEEWLYGDPHQTTVRTDTIFSEPGTVSVSQDGTTWFTFDYTVDANVPAADDFAPTLGRVFDENNPYDGYGAWQNLWWGDETDPTVPLDPDVRASDFIGKTVAQICQMYGQSAGGSSFDLQMLSAADYDTLEVDPLSGRKWIQFIKIECLDSDNVNTPEIDAVADVAACGDYKHPYPQGDINHDCIVDMADFAIMSKHWMECTWKCGQ